MEKKKIVVLDSGIGGLSVLRELDKALSNTTLIYLGDNLNAPYGNKSVRELWSLSIDNLELIKEYNASLLVLGCNTLSVNLIDRIEDYLSVKTIGTFPPVESSLINGEKTLLLSTVATAKKFSNLNNLTICGLENLAGDIEAKLFNLDKINLREHFRSLISEKNYFDVVILGCTHYEFLKNQIFNHFQPKKISSGVDFAINQTLKTLKITKSLGNKRENEILFIGKSRELNQKFYKKVVKILL
ncbi:MAG: aspartate/glutamate racemase family protein [Clostridia bacterium]|nr:aspartate/glutamate racemase family protein [Clostridia bacterium]